MKLKLLIIDDEILWQNELSYILKDKYDLVTASEPQQAMQIIVADHDLDLVLVDLLLASGVQPEGLEILELIRRIRPTLPVIAVSNYLSRYAEELRKLGVESLDKAKAITEPDILITGIEKAIASHHYPTSAAAELLRNTISAEIEKYALLKSRTLDIPGEGPYELIKPLVGFKGDLEKRLAKYPFYKNVFLMMKFRDSNKRLAQFMVEWLSKHGLRGIRADNPDWNITSNVYNSIAVMYCCKYGIALFDEAEAKHEYSPNVAYELGMMHCQGKSCLILRHTSLSEAPFDLTAALHQPYSGQLEIRELLDRWVQEM